MRVLQRAVVVALIAVGGPALVAGQRPKWVDPYLQGRDAVKEARYDEGIRLLLDALKIAPRQERVKLVEGGFTTEYYPYYYLGVAYRRLQQWDRAEEAFRKAKECKCLTRDLSDLMAVYEGEVAAGKNAANKPVPGPQPPGPPPGPTVDPNFVRQLNEAETAAASGRYPDAIRLYDTLRQMNPTEYARRNLADRRAEAARSYAQQLVKLGDQAAANGALNDARARYQEAENLVTGMGQPGLDEIRRRQSEYSRLKSAAEADQKSGNIAGALDKLRQAGAADPEQYRADNLIGRVQDLARQLQSSGAADKARELIKRAQGQVASRNYGEAASLYHQALVVDPQNTEARAWVEANDQFVSLRDTGRKLQREGKLDQALQSLDDARRRDEQRFQAEGLDALVKSITDKLGTLPEEQVAPVRDALVAFLQGDAAKAASLLEPLAGASLDPRVKAHVHAYLGAAYGSLSIAARDDAQRGSLHDKALEQFRQLLAMQPAYRLSESLISPRVRQMFDEAKK